MTGRLTYSEAVTATGAEQLLQIIVRERYGQSLIPMKVASVTANMRFAVSAGGEFGIGPDSNFAGNLVPLSAGVAYEQNPTISYVPIDNASYLGAVLSPISLENTLLLLQATDDRRLTSLLLLERLNGLKNPVRRTDSSAGDDFDRAWRIIDLLVERDVIELASLDDDRFAVLVHLNEVERQGLIDELGELLDLLQLRAPDDDADQPDGDLFDEDGGSATDRERALNDLFRPSSIDSGEIRWVNDAVAVIPIRFSGVADDSSIAITTRSLSDLVKIGAVAVDVPSQDLADGVAPRAGEGVVAGGLVHIRRAESRPKRAAIATRFRDAWFYIDERDQPTKLYFRLLLAIWSAELRAAGDGEATPVLTVPVSR